MAGTGVTSPLNVPKLAFENGARAVFNYES